MDDQGRTERCQPVDRRRRHALPFGDVRVAVPGDPAAVLNSGLRHEVEAQRAEHRDHVGGDIGSPEDVAPQVQHHLVRLGGRFPPLEPPNGLGRNLELLQVVEPAIVGRVVEGHPGQAPVKLTETGDPGATVPIRSFQPSRSAAVVVALTIAAIGVIPHATKVAELLGVLPMGADPRVGPERNLDSVLPRQLEGRLVAGHDLPHLGDDDLGIPSAARSQNHRSS